MLAIELHLLGGRYRASSFADRRQPEWPPDPARLFYAAVDATLATSEVNEDEVAALRWWEALEPPEIACSDARLRAVVDHYVPGNSATSWVRDFQGQWQDLADRGAEITAARSAGDQRSAAKAERVLDKANIKLRADTKSYTSPTGKESEQVMTEAMRVLPEYRGKQARTFPTATPGQPVVHFIWPTADLDDNGRQTLDNILARISRVGHSSSTASCRTIDNPPPPTWKPTNGKRPHHQLRTTAHGLLDALIQEHARHGGYRERVLPALMTGYGPAVGESEAPTTQSEMGDWIVLPFEKRQQLPPSRTLDIARSVRAALISHAPEPVSPIISGHAANNSSAEFKNPHISVLTLPNVTHVHSDGYVQAVAIGLPEGISPMDRAAVLDALNNWSGSTAGYSVRLPGGIERRLTEARVDAGIYHKSLRPPTVATRQFWARKHSEWSSVTPVALDRHPRIGRDPDFDELAAAIAPIAAAMCRKSGLPIPTSVFASPVSAWSTVPPVNVGSMRTGRRGFPQYCVGGDQNKRRYTTHLTIRFDEPIQGPIVLGAGRYFGYGLMLPSPGSGKETE